MVWTAVIAISMDPPQFFASGQVYQYINAICIKNCSCKRLNNIYAQGFGHVKFDNKYKCSHT